MDHRIEQDGISPTMLTRTEFPGALESTYLSSCMRGLMPASGRKALDRHLDSLVTGRTDKAGLFDLMEETRSRFAGLVNADADEIAFTKNVSEGLNIIAASMPWQAGDNVVVTLGLEHPNNVFPWLNQKERTGIEVRIVPERDGHIDIDAMIAAIDDKTRLVTMPTVTFSPGFRADTRKIGAFCRERDIFLLVDAVQSVGVLNCDVQDMIVDGFAVSTQKGLCGLYGMGFLYCRREWADRMTPAYLARFGVNLGGGASEAATATLGYDLMPGARRFDLGNYNYPAAAVVHESLGILADIGMAEVERHVTSLSCAFADRMLALGLPVMGGPSGPHLASIVSIGHLAEGHDSTSDSDIQALSDHLTAHDVIHSIRRGMMRFAFHIYNTTADIDRVESLVRDWQSSRS